MSLLNIAMMDAAVLLENQIFLFQSTAFPNESGDQNNNRGSQFPFDHIGHSTFSGAAATILSHILPARADAYNKMADDASKSRLWAASITAAI